MRSSLVCDDRFQYNGNVVDIPEIWGRRSLDLPTPATENRGAIELLAEILELALFVPFS